MSGCYECGRWGVCGAAVKMGRGGPLTGPPRSQSPGSLRQARASRSSGSDGSGQQGLGGCLLGNWGGEKPSHGRQALGAECWPLPLSTGLSIALFPHRVSPSWAPQRECGTLATHH